MFIRIRRKFAVLMCAVIFAATFSGCVSQYKVVVMVSPELRDFYTKYPSIEVDIAAVTGGEADELKNARAENYFAPNSALRARLEPKTFYFTEEDQAEIRLGSRDRAWKNWLGKKPASVVIIASLPPDPASSPQAPDPRILVVPMKKSYVIAPTLNVEIDRQKLTLLTKDSISLKKALDKAKQLKEKAGEANERVDNIKATASEIKETANTVESLQGAR